MARRGTRSPAVTTRPRPTSPRAFTSAVAFRRWLEAHDDPGAELVVRLFKVHARHRGMTYTEALDEALCMGWIDGVRRAVDADSFSVRFTPRRRGSVWSAVNIRRARALEAAGHMREPGRAAFAARREDRARIHAHESGGAELAPALRKRLDAVVAAARFFDAQPPWYRRTCAFWVMSAKREETRKRRLATLIECSAEQRTVPPLTRPTATKRAK
jgi:uncharacterized protein YdeI (YjbR/CyaY-like superfamily)